MLSIKPQILFCIVGLLSLVGDIVDANPLRIHARADDWLLEGFQHGSFSEAESKVTGLKLDKRISSLGRANGRIYSVSEPYKDHASDDLIVKQFVASGMLTDERLGHTEKPVIVMIKQPGENLKKNQEYKQASKKEKVAMRKQAIELACQKVAEDAVDLQIYHDDNNMDNVLVTVRNKQVTSARIVGYGAERLFHVEKGVRKEDVAAYCEKETLSQWK
ncbi:hypothetical protein GYMLUDRAFT_239464 [Collybiopsis luxurians FD-317 M1]|nr:hypothetical protein GYMLUDRAFT_239464 [Collybiopsis luxurians FD-317 M1]